MSLATIRATSTARVYRDAKVGALHFQEPTARQALAWTFRLNKVAENQDTGAAAEAQLSIMLEAFIACYLPVRDEEPATERDAELAYRLTGGWHTGTLAVFVSELISGGLGIPDSDEEEAAQDFGVSSTE